MHELLAQSKNGSRIGFCRFCHARAARAQAERLARSPSRSRPARRKKAQDLPLIQEVRASGEGRGLPLREMGRRSLKTEKDGWPPCPRTPPSANLKGTWSSGKPCVPLRRGEGRSAPGGGWDEGVCPPSLPSHLRRGAEPGAGLLYFSTYFFSGTACARRGSHWRQGGEGPGPIRTDISPPEGGGSFLRRHSPFQTPGTCRITPLFNPLSQCFRDPPRIPIVGK
ncbi:MAG: hypothetical protein QOH06_2669 [Acidobacteriota bacterium]|nr:hypothetical protein [Acidobacteriota bacterium]